MKTYLYLCWLILQSPADDVDKALTIYHLYQCEERETTSAIVIYETGYLQSYKLKVDCAQKYNNIFGWRHKNKYLAFNNYAQSVRYYRRWQGRHWAKYKKKHPDKSYYDFLKWIGYCNQMGDYVRTIKRIER